MNERQPHEEHVPDESTIVREEATSETESAEFLNRYGFDDRDFYTLSEEEQHASDTLLEGDFADIHDQFEKILALPENAELANAILEENANERKQGGEVNITEVSLVEQAAELQQEEELIIAETLEEKKSEVRAKLDTIVRGLIIAGGLSMALGSTEASAGSFDLGQILREGVAGAVQDRVYENQQQRQLRYNADMQLRQAQFSYQQQIRYIDGQIANLDNPRVKDLARQQANLYWNAQYNSQMAYARTPQEQARVKQTIDAQRAQATAQAEMNTEQQRLSLEQQRAQVDINFENQKISIVENYKMQVAQMREQNRMNRANQYPGSIYYPR